VIFTGEAPPPRLNLARYCLSGKPAEKTALVIAGSSGLERWSYGALEDTVLRMAEGLRRAGLDHGERLYIRMGNSLDYALLYFAAAAAGAVPIPASPLLTPREVDLLIRHSGARFLAWDGELSLPALEGVTVLPPDEIARLKQAPAGNYADTGPNDPAYLIFTSGTSGTPKGVLHGHRAIWGRRPMYQGWYGGIGPDDVMLHTGAFNWTYTSVVYTGEGALGDVVIVLVPQFPADPSQAPGETGCYAGCTATTLSGTFTPGRYKLSITTTAATTWKVGIWQRIPPADAPIVVDKPDGTSSVKVSSKGEARSAPFTVQATAVDGVVAIVGDVSAKGAFAAYLVPRGRTLDAKKDLVYRQRSGDGGRFQAEVRTRGDSPEQTYTLVVRTKGAWTVRFATS